MGAPRRHRVSVLVLPGVLPLEFGAATQIFARDPHYDLTVCAQARTVPGSGFTITTAASSCARYLVAPPQRHGGQAQYVERLARFEGNGNELDSLREWMRENLALPLDLDLLAQRAHMSRRTLTRRFRDETGVAPMAWLTDVRLDRARQLLEATAEPVEKIGRLTGLGAPASVRAAFHRRVGTSPQEYRSLFRHLATSG